MPEKVLKKFEIKHVQILDEKGNCDEKLKPKDLTGAKLREIYELMVLSRVLDNKMFSLQRQGRPGTLNTEAKFNASWKSPSLVAPSPR